MSNGLHMPSTEDSWRLLAGRSPMRMIVCAVVLACQLGFFVHNSALAHGTNIQLGETEAVRVVAQFDNGEPMANAQITVYSPSDSGNPWLTGEANEDGVFVFAPDASIPGQWDIQVRTAGHGDWVYLEVAEGAVASITGTNNGLTTAQIIMMSASVIWGLIGTALYFSRSKKEETIPTATASSL